MDQLVKIEILCRRRIGMRFQDRERDGRKTLRVGKEMDAERNLRLLGIQKGLGSIKQRIQ